MNNITQAKSDYDHFFSSAGQHTSATSVFKSMNPNIIREAQEPDFIPYMKLSLVPPLKMAGTISSCVMF